MTNLESQMLGPYRVEEKLGEGGAATIYRGYQPSMDRYVAIKVLKVELAEQDPSFVERFALEAKTIAQLQHPHILPVIDFGQTEDFVYLVMVLMPGGTLRQYIREHGALSLQETSFMLAQVASALDRAHDRGIIHRDLKPENILMDEDRNVYLTDFGLARILESARRLTATGLLMGTPHYISPEQARGEMADVRSDIYSLGIMLYEMLTGKLPFQADTAYGILFKHINEDPPRIREVRPELPQAVEEVVLKALAKNPDDRYQSALDMAGAFAEAMPGTTTVTIQTEEQAAHQPRGTRETQEVSTEALFAPRYTPTPTRLTPQRLAEKDKIIITDNPDDPDIALPLANGYMHYALRALEEVAGLQTAEIILRFARLENLLDKYPANNMRFDQGYTFKDYADLGHAILNYYGATGREAVMHIGRLSARWMILDQPLFGFTNAALRLMPAAAALRLTFNKTADGWRKIWNQVGVKMEFHLIEKPDFFLFAAQRCTCCTGKKASAPICWIFEAGFAEGGLIIKGKNFPVKEIACRAMGAPYCVWRIDKKPID
jgi:serine/threonine protein kinase/predicted hydrocarbon binding protein